MRWASSWAADRNFTNATDANRWPSQVIGAQVIAGMSVDKGARRTLTHDSAGKQTRSVLSIIEGISAVTLAKLGARECRSLVSAGSLRRRIGW